MAPGTSQTTLAAEPCANRIKRREKQDCLPWAPSHLFTTFLFFLLILSGGLLTCTSGTSRLTPCSEHAPHSLYVNSLRLCQSKQIWGKSNASDNFSILFLRIHQRGDALFCDSSIMQKTQFPAKPLYLTCDIKYIYGYNVKVFQIQEGINWLDLLQAVWNHPYFLGPVNACQTTHWPYPSSSKLCRQKICYKVTFITNETDFKMSQSDGDGATVSLYCQHY